MRVAVIGTGYVGLVTGACLSDRGHSVTCVDIDEEKMVRLQQGELPIYEPGLQEIVTHSMREGRLTCTTSYAQAMDGVDVVFLAVGTPPKENGAADLQYIFQATEQIAQHLTGYAVIVGKSTVPVGTNRRIKQVIAQHYDGDFDIASNPEFLREGSAVEDFMKPDRIVVGLETDRARTLMEELYAGFACPKLFMDVESAEMVKYASNAFLATKISFINEIANVCDNVGASVDKVAEGMGLDRRIGPHFLRAGLGYGGSCFPNDVRALHQTAGTNGYVFQLLRSVIDVNNNQRWHFFERIQQRLGELSGKTIGVWGLAFKPNTDDIRESVALDLIDRFLEEGAMVQAYDPQAMKHLKKFVPDIVYTNSPLEAAQGADALLMVTEWNEFITTDMNAVRSVMKQPVFFDGRNAFDPHMMKSTGWEYYSIGR